MSTEQKTIPTADIMMVVDESGSMYSMGTEPKEAINQFINDQKTETTDSNAQFSLYLFNTKVRKVYVNTTLSDVKEFNDYYPDGMTALFDAIGNAITDKLKTNRNKNVVLVVITDGEENSSNEYRTRKSIADLIKKAEDEYNWKVMFIGANIDAFSEGSSMNIKSAHCAQYNQNKKGELGSIIKATSEASKYYRSTAYCGVIPHELDLTSMNSDNKE